MAVKYQGGVICCADSSTFFLIQELLLVVSTLLIESPIKSTTSMTISACSEVEPQVNRNKLRTRSDTWLIPTVLSRASFLMSWLRQECSKKWTTKSNFKLDTLLLVGTHTKALKFIQWTWEEPLLNENSRWEDQAVGSFTDIAMLTTSRTWHTNKLRTSALLQCHWLWRETAAQEVSLDWRTSLRRDWKRSTTLMKVCLSNLFDCFIDLTWLKH